MITVSLGSPLCPCRFYENKEEEAKDGYWNCPCVPMRERHECHCMLFLTEDNAFAGDEQVRLCVCIYYVLLPVCPIFFLSVCVCTLKICVHDNFRFVFVFFVVVGTNHSIYHLRRWLIKVRL